MLWEIETALDDSEGKGKQSIEFVYGCDANNGYMRALNVLIGSYDGIELVTQLEDPVDAVVFDASDTLLVLCVGVDVLILEVNTGGQYCRLEGHSAKVIP